MFSRADRLRFRRKVRMQGRQLTTLGEQTEQELDRHFFRRLERLGSVRRFVFGWAALLVGATVAVVVQGYMLGNYYQAWLPSPGGTYTEGVVGDFTNANPLYATTLADKTVSKLLFSGLLRYDEYNNLTGDLAAKWAVDARGEVYTVTLRKDLHWHDGRPLTAADVVFTYDMIRNADAQSPLRSSWQGVDIKAADARTIVFTLDTPLAAFAHGLTTGIVPKHILQDVPATEMRSHRFNTAAPIGSGPFRWQGIEVEGSDAASREVSVALEEFSSYHLGDPKLNGFTVRVFRSQERMLASYEKRELHAMAGLVSVPKTTKTNLEALYFPRTAAQMVFFKNVEGTVLGDKAVRQALVRAADTAAIRQSLGYVTKPVTGPLLKGQVGFDPELVQLSYDFKEATRLLDAAGWQKVSGKQVRMKDGKPLEFTLYAEKSQESELVTRMLSKQWSAIGAQVKFELRDPADLQMTLSDHSYDALLRGISIGKDPDVFVYWHSSQAEIGSGSQLNFSEYKSKAADTALETSRTRLDETLRKEKYRPFLENWREDAPALGLYQPVSLYLTRGPVHELKEHEINEVSDRLANVHEWMIRRQKTTVD